MTSTIIHCCLLITLCLSGTLAQDTTAWTPTVKPLQASPSQESRTPSRENKLQMPGPELQNLMLGTWSTQVKYEPTSDMPNGSTGTGTEIWRLGPGGLSVIEESHERNAKGEVEGLGVAWWDAKAQGQRFV